MAEKKAVSPLVYLKNELGFPLGEWQGLPKDYQEWYRNAAIEEMQEFGIPVK